MLSSSAKDFFRGKGKRHKMPVLLELFSGTGSVGRAFRDLGWEVISVDNDPKANATFCCDVATWDCSCLLGGIVDVIWASPPCTLYSKARTTGSTTDDGLEASDALVRRALEIAEVLGNPPLFVENPYTGSLKLRGILDSLSLRVVDYCRYGMPYRKRTAIWTNTSWTPSQPLCKKHDCPSSVNGKHIAIAQRGGGNGGPRFSQRELYRIPAPLCDKIAQYCTTTFLSD